MWGSGAQRQPSGSSNASVADVSSTQRDTWASSRPSSGSWELPQTTDLTESPQKKDYSQLVSVKIQTYNEQNHIECLSVKDPQSPMNPGPRNRNSSGLSARIVSCQLKFNFKIFFFTNNAGRNRTASHPVSSLLLATEASPHRLQLGLVQMYNMEVKPMGTRTLNQRLSMI